MTIDDTEFVADVGDTGGNVSARVTPQGTVTVQFALGEKPFEESIQCAVVAQRTLNSALGEYRVYRIRHDLAHDPNGRGAQGPASSIDSRLTAMEARVSAARERIHAMRAGTVEVASRSAGREDTVAVEEQGGFISGLQINPGFYDDSTADEVALEINTCLESLSEGWRP